MLNLNQTKSPFRSVPVRNYQRRFERAKPPRVSEPELQEKPLAEHRYTYDEYAALTDGVRYEVIDGILFAMAAPMDVHQVLVGEMYINFRAFLEGKPCQVRISPYDVRILADPDSPDDGSYKPGDKTVVQPDVLVICDKKKIHPEGCRGVPDLVVEILSHSNTKHDTEVKFKIYEAAGVREYWIVDPYTETVIVYNLKDGIYAGVTYAGAVSVPSKILNGCVIDMEKVFRYAKE
jgi:Uma2 family endonuclease